MCCVMGNGVLQGMSVVIGICGTNFCTFWADGRKIVDDDSADGGFRIEGDDHWGQKQRRCQYFENIGNGLVPYYRSSIEKIF